MASSKKDMSAHQPPFSWRPYKNAWFLAHRIREAMRAGGLMALFLGSGGKVGEADETFIGRKEGVNKARAAGHHTTSR